jgi:hypothetical protein
MAIKVIKPAEISNWPKNVECSLCHSHLEVERLEDVKLNDWTNEVFLACPVCQTKNVIPDSDFSSFELELLKSKAQYQSAADYYDK